MVLAPWPGMGAALILYGRTLVWLMLRSGAAVDLGPWGNAFEQPARSGSWPGRGMWSPPSPKPEPWSSGPTTLPWLRRRDSGPEKPWWEVWRAALGQGIALWEALVVGALLVAFWRAWRPSSVARSGWGCSAWW